MQVFIIKKNGKAIYVGLNTDVTPKQYDEIIAEVEKNQKEADAEHKQLVERLANAEKEIKNLKHEIAVDRGEVEG